MLSLLCTILHIHICDVKSDAQLTSIRSIATRYPQFRFLEVNLEDAFSKEWWSSLPGNVDEELASRYIDLGEGFKVMVLTIDLDIHRSRRLDERCFKLRGS